MYCLTSSRVSSVCSSLYFPSRPRWATLLLEACNLNEWSLLGVTRCLLPLAPSAFPKILNRFLLVSLPQNTTAFFHIHHHLSRSPHPPNFALTSSRLKNLKSPHFRLRTLSILPQHSSPPDCGYVATMSYGGSYGGGGGGYSNGYSNGYVSTFAPCQWFHRTFATLRSPNRPGSAAMVVSNPHLIKRLSLNPN